MEAERHTAHLEEVGWSGLGREGRPLMFMGGSSVPFQRMVVAKRYCRN